MPLTDTHCHIQSIGQEKGERVTRSLWGKLNLSAEEVISESVTAGVDKIVCVGCDPEDSRLAVDFAAKHENTYASAGIHPHEAKIYQSDESLANFKELVFSRPDKLIAIGECGLDYYYGHSQLKDQEKVLRFQIELAVSTGLPLIFHVREAFAAFWPIFDSYNNLRGVLHSYTDNLSNLDMALERGLFVGVNGIATFAKEPHQLDVFKAIPKDRLLLETDSPFLTPTPYRGNINTPKHLVRVAEFLAELRGEKVEEIVRQTSYNTHVLLGI